MEGFDLNVFVRSNVTKTIHTDVYPAIDPTRRELSQKGKTVLITGAAGVIGSRVASAFVKAGASRLFLIGRTVSTLESTAKKLQAEAKEAGVDTVITCIVCDISKTNEIDDLWKKLEEAKIAVDVLVLSATAFGPGMKAILDVGKGHVWAMYETSVRSTLWFAEHFQQQGGPGKSLIFVSTGGSHAWSMPTLTSFASYAAIKVSGGQLVQQIAFDTNPEEMQVNIFHPGTIWNETGWGAMGVTKDMVPFDQPELAGAYAVWAASPEARFLHGRFTWASWDVEELGSPEMKKKFEEDVELLRYGVDGLFGANWR